MATFQKITNPGDIITGDIKTEGQKLADSGYVPVAPDTTKLNSGNLGNTPQVNYQSPEPTPTPDVANIPSETTPPPAELSKPQSDLQSMINELTSTNLTLEGDKQTFKTGLEQKSGLEEQMKAETDLSAQLKQLQAEATNIPNQLQLSAEGRGITAGGLAPIQTAELRRNSIKANTVGALLAATQGKIAFANSLIDRAVQAEFGPKEARQKALLANLDIIIKSPEYTEDEKKRALAQKKIQDAETAKIEQDKADKTSIYNTATEAAKNGADSLTLQKIQQAKTPEEAMLASAGFTSMQDKIAMENSLAQNGYSYVSTPAQRDRLKAQGYEILQQADNNGVMRTYAKLPTLSTKNITVGSGKTAKEYLITYDKNGKELKRELISGGGGSNTTPTSNTKLLQEATGAMENQIKSVVGGDGFISPDNYTAARNAWIQEGFNATTFDTKFKGYRNPNNPNYVVSKQTKKTTDRSL